MSSINCQHNPDTEWTGTEALEHFFECQTLKERQAQLLQWRDAARKFWDGTVQDGTVQDGKAYRVYDATDMFVHVVLPGFTSLTCGDSEPVDDAVMETFSARDLAVMLTLLRAAEQEIITAQGKANDRAMRERYGEPFGYPAPMPYPSPPVVVPPAPVVQP